MSLILYVHFLAAPQNSVTATLDKWRAEIRAKVADEDIYKANKEAICRHGAPTTLRIMCSAHVHCITNPSMYLNNRELKRHSQQAEQDKL